MRFEGLHSTVLSVDVAYPQPYKPDWTSVAKKTPEEMAHIAETVKATFLFAHLNEAQRTTIFEVMERVNVAAHEVRLAAHPLP